MIQMLMFLFTVVMVSFPHIDWCLHLSAECCWQFLNKTLGMNPLSLSYLILQQGSVAKNTIWIFEMIHTGIKGLEIFLDTFLYVGNKGMCTKINLHLLLKCETRIIFTFAVLPFLVIVYIFSDYINFNWA